MRQKVTMNSLDSNYEENDSLENHIVELARSGKLAGAARCSIEAGIAKGLPITFQRGESIVKRYPDGREEILAVLRSSPFKVPEGIAIIGKL